MLRKHEHIERWERLTGSREQRVVLCIAHHSAQRSLVSLKLMGKAEKVVTAVLIKGKQQIDCKRMCSTLHI